MSQHGSFFFLLTWGVVWCSCQFWGKNVPKLANAQVHQHDCFHIAPSSKKKSPKGLNPIYYLCHMSYIFILWGAPENKTDSTVDLAGLCWPLRTWISLIVLKKHSSSLLWKSNHICSQINLRAYPFHLQSWSALLWFGICRIHLLNIHSQEMLSCLKLICVYTCIEIFVCGRNPLSFQNCTI